MTYRGLGCDAEENAVLASLCSYEKQVMLVSLSVPLAFQVCGRSLSDDNNSSSNSGDTAECPKYATPIEDSVLQ